MGLFTSKEKERIEELEASLMLEQERAALLKQSLAHAEVKAKADRELAELARQEVKRLETLHPRSTRLGTYRLNWIALQSDLRGKVCPGIKVETDVTQDAVQLVFFCDRELEAAELNAIDAMLPQGLNRS